MMRGSAGWSRPKTTCGGPSTSETQGLITSPKRLFGYLLRKKAGKALLYHQGEELVMGHSVKELCERAAASTPDIEDKCAHWGLLDGFYVPTRYPDALPGSIPARVYDRRSADDAVATATEVVETVRTKMAT